MFETAHLPSGRTARAALVAGVLASGTLTGCVLAALAVEACRWLFKAEPILTSL